ncbi:DUF421 domain-containing protein [Serratia liquefaciens]|uniref:DUF421 domain-containing protein n=1 Tax=Serratia liquefaciens TaxID=614 RepID=UPI00235F0C58|nr:YetF domain-containing protein [Serratia liquefaciens]
MHVFDVDRMLINSYPYSYLLEVALRSTFTFFVVYIFLRLIGRRGVKQMTLFEIVIILTLGSAAGDVALNEDSPLLPVIVTFIVIIGFYRVFTFMINKNAYFQSRLEGKPVMMVKEGVLQFNNATRQSYAFEEFIMELREKGVEHLGQIKLALLEIDGNLSVYFYRNEDVKPGLPILPIPLIKHHTAIEKAGYYSCIKCSHTQHMDHCDSYHCPTCRRKMWAESSDSLRIT